MTTALDWRSLPTATHLSPFERDMLYLREQGRTPSEIAELLHVSLRVVSPALTVAARRLGFAGMKDLVRDHGWPSVYRAHAQAPACLDELVSVKGLTVEKKQPKREHEPFSHGMTVHVHAEAGLLRGRMVAFNSDMVLLQDGSEVQRSRVHVGEECRQ